jgi:hypothetical protein
MSDIRPFNHADQDYARFAGIKNKALQRAVDDAWVHLGRPRPDFQGKLLQY